MSLGCLAAGAVLYKSSMRMKKIFVFLADGFEEVEALATVDILRRAGLEVATVSLADNRKAVGAHGVPVEADEALCNVCGEGAQAAMLVMPGGLPGATNLSDNATLRQMITDANEAGVPLSAICAAPLVYGRMGLLKGVRATCYTGFEGELEGAIIDQVPVVVDGRFTTAWGPGAAFDFAYAIVERFCGKEKVKELKSGMRVY